MGWWKIKDIETGGIDWSNNPKSKNNDIGNSGLINAIPGIHDPEDLYNGDDASDEFSMCIDNIFILWYDNWGRFPKKEELIACLNFNSNIYYDTEWINKNESIKNKMEELKKGKYEYIYVPNRSLLVLWLKRIKNKIIKYFFHSKFHIINPI